MKASNYHSEWDDDPVLEKLAEYTKTYPLRDETLADLDWWEPEDEILFYQDIEEFAETDFTDEALESAFDGTLKVAHLIALLEIMEKNARISTQSERTKARQYRMKNKAEIARKAKIRRMKERTGMRRRKKRIGTAAGGYQFITAPQETKRSGGGNAATPKASTHAPKGDVDFNPAKNLGSTQRRAKLKGL